MYKKMINQKAHFLPLETVVNGQVLEAVLSTDGASYKTVLVEGREVHERDIQSISVPGRAGYFLKGSKPKGRPIVVTGIVSAVDAPSYQRFFQRLNRLLNHSKGISLSFSDEPGIFYEVVFEKADDPNGRHYDVVLKLEFSRPNPYKFSDVRYQVGNSISYNGHYPTKPKITLTLAQAGTELRLLHVEKQQYVRIRGRYEVGNQIVIDMTKRTITQNGRDILADLDMVNSRFFEFTTGTNTLNTNLRATVQSEYREVYL